MKGRLQLATRLVLSGLVAGSVLLLSGCGLFGGGEEPGQAEASEVKPLAEDRDPLAPPELASSAQGPAPAATPTASSERPLMPLVVSKTGDSIEESEAKAPLEAPSLTASEPRPAGEPFKAPESEPFKAPESAPGLSPVPAKPDERRVDVFARDLDVRVAAHMIASQAGVELELSPAARGNISLRVKNEPWRRALERALSQIGEFELRGRGDLVRVEPRPLLVEGQVVARDAESVTVRRSDGKEFTGWLPPTGDVDRDGLAAILGALAPKGKVALVCNAFEERLVLRSVVSSR